MDVVLGMLSRIQRRNKKKEGEFEKLTLLDSSGGNNLNLEFIMDCILIKEFKVLPSIIKEKNLDELYTIQKKLLVWIMSYAIDTDDIRSLLLFDREAEKIDALTEEELFHPIMLEELKITFKDNPKGYQLELTKRANLLRVERKRILSEKIRTTNKTKE